MTTATQIQAVAAVESLLNPIDQLFVLDRQQKTLAAQVKTLKDTIANTYDVSAKDAAGKYHLSLSPQHKQRLTLHS